MNIISGVKGDRVHFYGNSGVCLFKYLVTPDDSQKEFTVLILALNFCCFIIILINYIVIFTKTKRSSKKVKNSQSKKGFSKMEVKITTIILTDFVCWIPLTVVGLLHFGEVIDATPWYPIFSSILLPLNSVINPILYNQKIEWVIVYLFNRASQFIRRLIGIVMIQFPLSKEKHERQNIYSIIFM